MIRTIPTKTSLAAGTLALALGLGGCASEEPLPPAQTEEEAGDGAGDGADEGGDDTAGDAEDADGTADDGAGTAAAVPPPGDDDGAQDTASQDTTEIALQAIDTAEEHAGGTAYEIDDQDEDGTWEVDVRVEDRSVEVTVDQDGVSVVGTEEDDLDDDDRAALDAATTSLQDAIGIAVDEVGGVLDDAELDDDNGTAYWKVELDGTDGGDDIEVRVSLSGEVLQSDL